MSEKMVVLGHDKILELIEKDSLIKNIDEKNIQPGGVDLRIKCIYKLREGGYLGLEKRKTPKVEVACNKIGERYCLKPNEFVLVETIEKINMSKDLLAIILPRSSLFRCGISLHTGVVDPGFQGTLTFGMKNLSKFPFDIEVGSKIGQIVFEEVKGNVKLYDGKYQGGKVT